MIQPIDIHSIDIVINSFGHRSVCFLINFIPQLHFLAFSGLFQSKIKRNKRISAIVFMTSTALNGQKKIKEQQYRHNDLQVWRPSHDVKNNGHVRTNIHECSQRASPKKNSCCVHLINLYVLIRIHRRTSLHFTASVRVKARWRALYFKFLITPSMEN